MEVEEEKEDEESEVHLGLEIRHRFGWFVVGENGKRGWKWKEGKLLYL